MADTDLEDLEMFINQVLEPPIDDPLGSESDIVPTPTIQNVVSTVNLGCKLDLKAIARFALNAEYNPKRFAAAIMRIREPKTTALIFSSGKLVCKGAKTEEQSHLATRNYARILQKLGFSVTFDDFKIQNIVASCDIRLPLSLVRLAIYHGQFTVYEPELFPGLIYRMKTPRVTILVFPSGNIVLAGARKTDQIFEAFNNIYPVLMSFKRNK